MKKLTILCEGRAAIALVIPPVVAGNSTFGEHLNYLFANRLKGYEAVSCERVYESGSHYPFPKKDWDSNLIFRSSCIGLLLTVKPTTITQEAKPMTHFTGVKEQVKHEIFGLDITTATKDQLIELAEFINKKIAAAKGLNLTTSLYVRNEISSLTALLDKTIAKLDEGVEV